MLPPLPVLDDYGISDDYGFLPPEFPLERLPDPYYNKWEAVVSNLQGLILTKRLRGVIDNLPVLSTAGLEHDSEWRRAYSLLCFMAHGYIWGGDSPSERLPASISVPLLHISSHLEVPPVANYAAVCLWNFKPLFADERIDNLENLATLTTFTGSIDESWFYLVPVAIEARGGPMLPLMLKAIGAARLNDSKTVAKCLETLAETLEDLGSLLQRMHECCDPQVFYHRVRPFLAGSKNMAEAGLPHGLIYEDGTGTEQYKQYSGGSAAQSSILQFYDIILGIEHRPTGEKKDTVPEVGAPPKNNFLLEMREYMPGPHKRFLEDVTRVANIRPYVESHQDNDELTIAYDSCLAMLRAMRDKHFAIVSRYIIIKSRESRPISRSRSPEAHRRKKVDITSASNRNGEDGKKELKGTGGTTLASFLKQARDETSESAVNSWAKRAMVKKSSGGKNQPDLSVKNDALVEEPVEATGLAGYWTIDDDDVGGICHY